MLMINRLIKKTSWGHIRGPLLSNSKRQRVNIPAGFPLGTVLIQLLALPVRISVCQIAQINATYVPQIPQINMPGTEFSPEFSPAT